ncbi:MAG: NAD(P)-dependent oxidoreductase [Thermoanaerobaculia bacterium]|nr:NAD(P)-dependent oxidoreductase [Thermoanaerobaculia bacterium]
MRLLITGGAGYIGSVLTGMALEQGHAVTVLDDLSFQQDSLLSLAHHPRFDFLQGDARNPDVLGPSLEQADAVIPLAALVGAPACDVDPDRATSVNLDAIRTLLELRRPEQRVLFANTNSGYGSHPDAVCTEETPFAPISLYGRTKVEAEGLVLESGNGLAFRLATAFGASPRMRFDLLVNDFVEQAHREGVLVLFESGFQRNFIHVRDIARAFLFGLENFESMEGQTFNVGLSDANLTKLELAERIRRQVPRLKILESVTGRDPDKRDYLVSNDKIESLGWRPSYSLDDGIAELLKVCRLMPRRPYRNI